ncbi:MAG: YicC/YloC family endoribonuclease [Myxococcota bacterium]|nr:YicC/YloC family endoribonuclease [Myxococcota bacterium]
MNSMKGYGRGEASNGSISIVIEIRSSNSRFRDIQVRVPKGYLALEPSIRKEITEQTVRGKIEVFVTRSTLDSTHKITPDPLLAERYLRSIQTIAKRVQKENEQISLTDIINRPGVLLIEEESPDAHGEWDLVKTALLAAIDHLQSNRTKNGEESKRHLTALLKELQRLISEIELLQEEIASHLHQRLETRLKRLLGSQISPRRLAQEAAILVDKSDISEELNKMRSQCDNLVSLLDAENPICRKAEFIIQDLAKDTNIISSKTPNHKVSYQIIDMKSILEQVREEAASIE